MKKDEKKRNTLGFEPEPEVWEMLQKAQQAGLTKGEIINEALKHCGKDVIKKLAVKHAESLAALNFFDAQLPLFGHLVAA